MSRLAAWFSAIVAAVLLGEVASEAIQGDLLEIKAGHIGAGSVLLLVAWLIATIYVAASYLAPPKAERDRREPDKVIAYAQEVRRLSRPSPSRDGTVAVEDVIAWLDSEANRLAGNGELSDTVAGAIVGVRMRLLAEFGSARAGESNEGGNQNDERRR